MSRTQTTSARIIKAPALPKNKKSSLIGGGRAWREDEEAYLLRTRLKKMPYKHIAAHLNKTELACRLYYHRLSHRSDQRRRTTSSPSGSDLSLIMPSMTPSPKHDCASRPILPFRRSNGRFVKTSPSQLKDAEPPGIMISSCSLSIPTILPQPALMGINSCASSPRGNGRSISESHAQLSPVSFHHESSPPTAPNPPRLNRSLPLPTILTHSPSHVDLDRLHFVYAAHRERFWNSVASEYGPLLGPATLETAWKSGRCCSPTYISLVSPEDDDKMSLTHATISRDKIRISSLISAE